MIFEISTYDPELVRPMRDEAKAMGFKELMTPDDVNSELSKEGYALILVNSVCGCAAGKARPGLKIAVNKAIGDNILPDRLLTVFAGMEKNATAEVRKYFTGYAPSSPQIALLKDGIIISLIERKDIENSDEIGVAEKVYNLIKEHVKRR